MRRHPLWAWAIFFGPVSSMFTIDWLLREPAVVGGPSTGGVGLPVYWGVQAVAAVAALAWLVKWVFGQPAGRGKRFALALLQILVAIPLWIYACITYSLALGYHF